MPAPSINWIKHKILHGFSGGLLGAASNLKDPLKGAWGGGFGGMGGEIFMEEMAPSFHSLQLKASRGSLTQDDLLDYKAQLERTSDLARFGTGFASFILKQDVNASVLTATNAIENNSMQAFVGTLALYHKQMESMVEGGHKAKEIAETEVEPVKRAQRSVLRLAEENLSGLKKSFSGGFKETLELVGSGYQQGEWTEIVVQLQNVPTTVGEGV